MSDEIARYTSGVLLARWAYATDMKVQSGLCWHDGCHQKHEFERRQCWVHSHAKGRAAA